MKETKENKECKNIYKHKDGLTYTDSKGSTRLISNDELVFYTHDKNGDYILENMSGYVYRNFSEEKRNMKIMNEKCLKNQNQ